ncbi:MAG: hypothetical protein WC046_00175 [Candidatus Bathyarchaeia archaeon]
MSHSPTQLFALTVIALLLSAMVLALSPASGQLNLASTSSTIPQADQEFANGTLASNNAPFKVWYNWVNVSNTQILYYAAYTTPDYPFPVPIANIVGQHFSLEDGTQVFIASALSELEVYHDLNGDGIPQTNTGADENEVLYYIYSNMSQGYSMTPIQKTTIDSVPHYQWSFTYQNAYAYLQNAQARVGVVARMFFEHLTLNYDFSVQGNVSDLKTSFDIGKVTNLEVLEPSEFSSFDDLSLALLYATATYTSKPYSTSVNGQPYDSSTADSAVGADVAEVKVDDVKAYDFVFGGNYTLNRDGSTETHGASVETYEAQAQAVPATGLPTIYGPTVRSIGFFTDYLNLADLFGGSWPSVNSNYESSSLIYRICFPEWDGMQIEHDPTFLGYIYNNQEIPEIPTITLIIIPIVIASSLALLFQRKRRLTKPQSRKFD